MENEHNVEYDKSISDSIYKSYTDGDSYGRLISTNTLKDFWDGNHVQPDINAIDYRFKISDRNRQTQSECKVA